MDRLPVYDLLRNADIVVQGGMLILAAASVVCWTIAFEKLMRIVAFSRQVSALERAGQTGASPSDWLALRMSRIADAEPVADEETKSEFNARLEKSLQIETSAQETPNRASLSGYGWIHRPFCRVIRHRVGHHAQLYGHSGGEGYESRRRRAGHRGSAVRDGCGPRCGHSGRDFL